ncbi:MAG TPA: hypothetical protein VFV86_06740 [Nitrososphaeraceae archaeon]|nr:hypothetical protein [Nitrososphaeraceae archaeon]
MKKEYLVYYEHWYGQDWMGRKIPPVTDHIEGVYTELEFEPVIEKNRKIGEKLSGNHLVHYIPFSKEAVDKIIENSDGSYKENINFTAKGPEFRNGQYFYEQFVNLSFEDCVRLMNLKGGPRLSSNMLLLEKQKIEEQEVSQRLLNNNNSNNNKQIQKQLLQQQQSK